MKVINLMENTKGDAECLYQHGLSFYIETPKHRILVDTGADHKFLENAKKKKIDLKKVDLLILSHGHYDHAGGIMEFTKINKKARIYMQKNAGNLYFHKSEDEERYIGIDPHIPLLQQAVLLNGDIKIDEELSLFTGVTGRKLWPDGNRVLKEKIGDEFIQDEFVHEQYLVITAQKYQILVSGCAHNGILNIMDHFITLYGKEPDIVLSGFHMMKKNGYTKEDEILIQRVAESLKKFHTVFYTGHCTGQIPYQILKKSMGDQIHYIHSGDSILLSPKQ